MHKTVMLLCGLLNAVFLAFHLLLATWIQRMPLTATARALMHAFNVGGLLMIAFLAFAFLFCRADLGTRLGRGAVLLGALVYLTRTAGELVFFPVPNPTIVVTCTAVGLLHLLALRTPGAPRGNAVQAGLRP